MPRKKNRRKERQLAKRKAEATKVKKSRPMIGRSYPKNGLALMAAMLVKNNRWQS